MGIVKLGINDSDVLDELNAKFKKKVEGRSIKPRIIFGLDARHKDVNYFVDMDGENFAGVLMTALFHYHNERDFSEMYDQFSLYKGSGRLLAYPLASELGIKLDERPLLYLSRLEAFTPGIGVGRKLVQAALEEDHSSAMVFSISESGGFYKKMGFEETGFFGDVERCPITGRMNRKPGLEYEVGSVSPVVVIA